MSKLQNRKRRKAFWLTLLAILSASLLVQLFLPWWTLVLVSFFGGFLSAGSIRYSFWAAFLALAIQWGVWSAILDYRNEQILSSRIVQLFPLPHNPLFLILLTAIIGGLIAGFAAWSGGSLRKLSSRNSSHYGH
jgi:hypothetical protein